MKMKVFITTLFALLLIQNVKAQSKEEEAQLNYEMAQEEYDKGNYPLAIQYLEGAESLSKAAKVKTSYIKARCFQKLFTGDNTPDTLYVNCLTSIKYYLDNGKDEDKRKELLRLKIKVDDALGAIRALQKQLEKLMAEKKKTDDAEKQKIAEEVAKGFLTIGNKVWSVVNLNVSTFNNGSKIAEAEDADKWYNLNTKEKPAWCYYNGDSGNGKLYNKYAATDSRGLAPQGWHIPSDAELKDLEENLKKDDLLLAAWKKSGIEAGRSLLGDFTSSSPAYLGFHSSTQNDGYGVALRHANGGGAYIRCVKD